MMEQPVGVLIPFLVDRFGTRMVEEDFEVRCQCCDSQRQARILSWRCMGQGGDRILSESLKPSRFVKDFPEFHCRHYWVPIDNGVPDEVVCGPAWGFARLYSENEIVCEQVQEEMTLGRVSREAVMERVEGEFISDTSREHAILDAIECGHPPLSPGRPLPILPVEPLVTGLRFR
jgi:hypothetical protein